MVTAIDIGNSSINIGFFIANGLIVKKTASYPRRDVKEYEVLIRSFLAESRIEREDISCIISSVVPGHTPIVKSALRMVASGKGSEVLTVSHRMRLGITLRVKAPREMGTDRIAAAVAAYEIRKSPVAVIDFGTATTITVVDAEGSCRGGAILPGLDLMNKVLEKGTSRLKAVALRPPSISLGDDTISSIRSGLFYGTAGAVDRILLEMDKEMGCTLATIITGGNGSMMAPYMKREYLVRPNLVLEGLRILYEFNRHT